MYIYILWKLNIKYWILKNRRKILLSVDQYDQSWGTKGWEWKKSYFNFQSVFNLELKLFVYLFFYFLFIFPSIWLDFLLSVLLHNLITYSEYSENYSNISFWISDGPVLIECHATKKEVLDFIMFVGGVTSKQIVWISRNFLSTLIIQLSSSTCCNCQKCA